MLQKKLKIYFTFDIKLIGSGDKKLVTQNGANGLFDLDYNLILQRDKKNLINNPHSIKNLFKTAFDEILFDKMESNKCVKNSTSVLTIKKIEENHLNFSFDVAILIEDNDGTYFRLTFDKKSNQYLWNQVPQSKDYIVLVNEIKKNHEWQKFKLRYLELKNNHLSKKDNNGSFSIFLETLNEFR